MSNFQIILTGIFAFFIIIGVIVFATVKGSGGVQAAPEVVLWGTIPQNVFTQFLSNVNLELPSPLKITYIQKNGDTFHQDFIEALATGRGPDAIILPQELILKELDKLAVIPYASFPERDFKNTFIQEAELYLTSQGMLAFPFSVDPLVMYWNRDTLSAAGFARPPKTWEEVSLLGPKVTVKDDAANISRTSVAMGEFRNVTHAKELLATLFMQAGNPLVAYSDSGPVSVLNNDFSYATKPAVSVLNFYTQFADPTNAFYSWNRAMPQSKNLFIAGDLAIYFGFASELPDIRAKNPQLNFDVASMPQSNSTALKATYGEMLGFAFPKASRNLSAAYGVIANLFSQSALIKWTQLTYLPPVRRDMLGGTPSDPYLSVFYSSALIAKGWLDPSANETAGLFQSMVENIVSGKERVGEAVSRSSSEIDNLIPKH